MKSTNIDIVLPSRIGDSILSIPAAVCLEQLNKKYANNHNIKVISKPFLVELFSSLGLFSCKGMEYLEKLKSQFFPSDKAFYVETTNANFGYRSKKNYGIVNPSKKFLKFQEQPVYLDFSMRPFLETWEKIKKTFPENLVPFLIEEKKLPWYSACLFGICLEAGYTAEQIIETFNKDEIAEATSQKLPQQDVIVFCIEAGYGRKHLHERCWNIDGYFKIAEKCAAEFGVKTAFIGMGTEPTLPDEDYIQDLRVKLSIPELANLMKTSLMYVGNDTGPMHVANLMQTPSVSMYFKEEHMTGFHPVFPEINKQLFRPTNIDVVFEEVSKVLASRAQKPSLVQNSV